MAPPFIDLRGASGAVYRFRLAQLDALPASAGNFVCAAGEPAADRIVCCGATLSLAGVASAWAEAVKAHGATALYLRLNIAARTRGAEHDDLALALKPPLVVAEADT